MTDRVGPDAPIHVLLLRLAWDLIAFIARFIAPFVIPLFLPLPLAVAYWLLAMLGEWVENRLRGQVEYTYGWMLGACFGLSLAVAKLVPGTLLGAGAGIACFCVLLGLQGLWKKLLRLKVEIGRGADRAASEPLCVEAKPASVTGASAWDVPAPVTPEGETLRLLSFGEFAMGSPLGCDYLFPDGSVILGVGASTGFSPDGRYFVSPMPSRESWGLAIYDRRDRLLHRCREALSFWEIDLVDDTTVHGRDGQPGSSRAYSARIDALIAHSSTETMVQVADLWIAETNLAHIRQQQTPFPPPPEGGPAITLLPQLPPSLMALADPLEPLYRPKAELVVDGVASGFLISLRDLEAVWRDDAGAFACEAEVKGGDAEHVYCLWTADIGWRRIPKGRNLHDDRPSALRDGFSALDADHLMIDWGLYQPKLAHDSAGPIDGDTPWPLEIGGRHHPAPVLRQSLPLAGDGRGDGCVESAPLRNGKRLVWCFLRRDEELSRDVHACAWEGRSLDGEWTLDHRIAADGRFAAIVAYAPPPFAPHRIAILDAETGALAWVRGDYCDARLQGFGEDALHFIHLVGRVHEGTDGQARSSAGAEPDEEVPPPGEARAFTNPRRGSRLHYRRCTATRRNGEWWAASL